MYRYAVIILVCILLFACQGGQSSKQQKEHTVITHHHSATISKIFDAHGGYQQWAKMKQLSYNKGEETHLIELRSRKIKLVSKTKTIGFDGENVWVTPDTIDASSARFYHNLYFYFFAMPFVVGDPGVFYEEVESKMIKDKNYQGVKISYDKGVGDSPNDSYILWYDPKTYQMEWLMYTVTYKTKTKSEDYRLIKYEQWKAFEGVLLPTILKWYEYENDEIGEERHEAVFTNIKISTIPILENPFAMPEKGAQIAPFLQENE